VRPLNICFNAKQLKTRSIVFDENINVNLYNYIKVNISIILLVLVNQALQLSGDMRLKVVIPCY